MTCKLVYTCAAAVRLTPVLVCADFLRSQVALAWHLVCYLAAVQSTLHPGCIRVSAAQTTFNHRQLLTLSTPSWWQICILCARTLCVGQACGPALPRRAPSGPAVWARGGFSAEGSHKVHCARPAGRIAPIPQHTLHRTTLRNKQMSGCHGRCAPTQKQPQ